MESNKNLIIAFVLTALLMGGGFWWAKHSSPVPKAPTIKSKKIATAQWINGVMQLSTVAFCNDYSYFRTCFKVDQQTCAQKTIKASEQCFKKMRPVMPKVLRMPDDAMYWGKKIGDCAGQKLEKQWHSRKGKNRSDCRGPEAFARKNPPPVLTKKSFLQSAAKEMPHKICQREGSVRQCFLIGDSECLKAATSATSQCVNKVEGEIPAHLQPPIDTLHWTIEIGHCALDQFVAHFKTRQLPGCRNP